MSTFIKLRTFHHGAPPKGLMFTSRKRICESYIFTAAPLLAGIHPQGQTPPRTDTPRTDTPTHRTDTLGQTPPRQTPPRQTPPGRQAGGMHPTGMHSCFHYCHWLV